MASFCISELNFLKYEPEPELSALSSLLVKILTNEDGDCQLSDKILLVSQYEGLSLSFLCHLILFSRVECKKWHCVSVWQVAYWQTTGHGKKTMKNFSWLLLATTAWCPVWRCHGNYENWNYTCIHYSIMHYNVMAKNWKQ